MLMLVVAGLHTLRMFSEPPTDPEGEAVVTAMKGYAVEVGLGMRPSVYDIHMSLGLTMTVLLVFLGMQNLIILTRGAPRELLRQSAFSSALCMWTLVVLYAVYRITPPLLCFVLLGVVFTASYLSMRRQGA